MSEIRVTYSGLISLVIGLFTVITGMIFLMIVTRTLTPLELGTWTLIGGLITYVVIIEPIISYWALRETARGIKSGRTAIVSSGGFSLIGILVYLIIAYFVGQQTDADVNILFFGVLMVPLMFLSRTLKAIALGWKPQVNSYGILIFDIAKIPAALVFIYFFEMGIQGAILSLVAAHIVTITLLLIFLRDKLKGGIKKKYFKKWLKVWWLPSYIKFPSMVVLDVLIFSVITGSVVGLSYWTAAFTISILVKHAGQITKAVYPKLLGGGSKEHLQENLTRFFYFVFPFIALSIVFARPALFALNPFYEVAVLVVIFLTFRAFLKILNGAFIQAIQGIEKVDINENATQKDYLKSTLFSLTTITYIQRGVYLGSLAVGLILLMQVTNSQLDLVIYWSIIAFVTQIPFSICYFLMARKRFPLSVNLGIIAKYLLISTTVFGGTYLLTEEFLEYKDSIFEFLPSLFLFISIGVIGYLGLTYLTDQRTRNLFKAVLTEIKSIV